MMLGGCKDAVGDAVSDRRKLGDSCLRLYHIQGEAGLKRYFEI